MINPECERTKPIAISEDFIIALKQTFSGSKAEKLPDKSHYPLYIGEDLLTQMKILDNQIIWGRRGTGKTHLLKAFNQYINEDKNNNSLSYYISCDTIRYETPISLEFNSDIDKMKYCAKNTFKCFMTDLLDQMMSSYEGILRTKQIYLKKNASQRKQMLKRADDVLLKLDENIAIGIPRLVESIIVGQETTAQQKSRNKGLEVSSSFSEKKLDVRSVLSFISKRTNDRKTETLKTNKSVCEFNIYKLQQMLSELLRALEVDVLYICIDELWLIDDKASLSYQPLFLDYLRQACFGIPNISVKIASIRETTKLNSKNTAQKCYGLQPGQDIVELAHLDSMKYTKAELVKRFMKILEARINYFSEERRKLGKEVEYGAQYIIDTLFGNERYFTKLIHLAHGIPRNILYFMRSCLAKISYDLSKYYLHIYLLTDTVISNYQEEKRANMPMNEQSVYMVINSYLEKNQGCFFMISTEQVKRYKTEINNLLYTSIIYRIPSDLTPNSIMDLYKAYYIDSGKYFSLIKEKMPEKYNAILNEFELSIPLDLKDNAGKYVVNLEDIPSNFIECVNCSYSFSSQHPVYVKYKCCVNCGFDMNKISQERFRTQ